MTIAAITTRRLEIPLTRPWGDDVRSLGVITVAVTDDRGRVGHGFSWTPTIGAGAVQALLDEDIRSFAIGRSSDPGQLWDALWVHLHEAGGGGLTTIAMAGLDLALWDLAAGDRPLVEHLGARRDSVPVYGSGINLHYPMDELVAQARRWVDTGYGAVKMKVGRPDLAEDVDRVAAVREVIGADRGLMVDANQRWNLDAATRAITALQPFNLDWVEEPLRADDLLAHRELRQRVFAPIALGENLHTIHRFADYIEAGVCDVVQPNVIRVGGVTPFRRIAALADDADVRIVPHLLTDLSGQLALTLERPTMVEEVEDAAFGDLGALQAPAPVAVGDGPDGRLLSLVDQPSPGVGLRFDEGDRFRARD